MWLALCLAIIWSRETPYITACITGHCGVVIFHRRSVSSAGSAIDFAETARRPGPDPDRGVLLGGEPLEHHHGGRLESCLGLIGHTVGDQHGGPVDAVGDELAYGDVAADRPGGHSGEEPGGGTGATPSGEVPGRHDGRALQWTGEPSSTFRRGHVGMDDVGPAVSQKGSGHLADRRCRMMLDLVAQLVTHACRVPTDH